MGQIYMAIANVLKRKRAEKLDLEMKMQQFLRNKEPPTKGLGSDIQRLNQEIRALEEAIATR